MDIGFDLLSDLNLDSGDDFDWSEKVTSLYCLVPGNISHDLDTVFQILSHLSELYQGVFYVPGNLEYKSSTDFRARTTELLTLTKKLPRVSMLYHHVVVIDGVAITGINGWSLDNPEDMDIRHLSSRLDDIMYLNKAVTKLQTHLDVKTILILSSCTPKKDLYFGKIPDHAQKQMYPDYCLEHDTEHKVKIWAYGGTNQLSDAIIKDVHYYSNPKVDFAPYWAKRISVKI